jgi:hypothetical protein
VKAIGVIAIAFELPDADLLRWRIRSLVVGRTALFICDSYERPIASGSISYARSTSYVRKEGLMLDVLLGCAFLLLCAWFVLDRLRHRI